jgi:pyrimidine operon attenuation protein/uracil phosphoribosyltransferase
MDESDVHGAVARMAREIVEFNEGTDSLVLMGIQRRGTQIAALLVSEIERTEGVSLEAGFVDITLYRDDLMVVGPRPIVGESKLPPRGVDGQKVVLIDDVLHTGRTIRAALNELTDWGRPKFIHLCVLVDRGGRELPIQPDIVGQRVELLETQSVEVHVPEIDGGLGVEIVTINSEAV